MQNCNLTKSYVSLHTNNLGNDENAVFFLIYHFGSIQIERGLAQAPPSLFQPTPERSQNTFFMFELFVCWSLLWLRGQPSHFKIIILVREKGWLSLWLGPWVVLYKINGFIDEQINKLNYYFMRRVLVSHIKNNVSVI